MTAQVGDLSRDLDENDAFVLFPEGGNFTEHRRKRAIARLRRKARDADVVFVAHTGVEHMVTVLDLWRELPMDREIQMRWWAVPAAEVPDGEQERVDRLFSWWRRIDDWISERRAEAGAVGPR